MIAELIRGLAGWLPLGYAFGAGMVATVNPCGFLMLPAYVALYLGTGEENPLAWPLRGLRALTLGLSITLGFVALFSAIGLVVSLGGQTLLSLIPGAGLAIGIALLGLGLWLLLGKGFIGIASAERVRVPLRKNWGFAFLFGVAYGVASLSCTLPIFLLVVGSALSAQGIAQALQQFLSYSLGMSAMVGLVIVSTAFFKGGLSRYVQKVTPYVHELSALFLMGAGAYLIFYWLRYGGLF